MLQRGSGRWVAVAGCWLACALPAVAGGATVTEFSANITAASEPHGITAGPDGNLWFTEYGAGKIGRITPTGAVTEFSAGITANAGVREITAGPDGNLWFTESTIGKIGRITPAGAVTEFTPAGLTAGDQPHDIVTGPDGNLWFTEYGSDRVGRLSPDGATLDELPSSGLSANSNGTGITVGPDGNIWFAELGRARIGRMSTAGAGLAEYPPAGLPGGATPEDITVGPDGNLWAAVGGTHLIARIATSGTVTGTFTTTTANSGPEGIAAGADGNLWFTEAFADKIGRITPAGTITEFNLASGAGPHSIAAGPDGNLWFTEPDKDTIGRITTDSPAPGVGNLLRNPGFESGWHATSDASTAPVEGWVAIPNFTAVPYGTAGGFPAALGDGGSILATGGPVNPSSRLIQRVDVSSQAATIDSTQGAAATLSGQLGGFDNQEDSVVITATYLSAAGTTLGATSIGPVSATDRGNVTKIMPRSATEDVPHGTRAIQVTAGATRFSGAYDDALLDNVSLTVAAAPPGVPVLQQAPALSGTPSPAFTLTCTPGTWSNSPTLTYVWESSTSGLEADTWSSITNSNPDPTKLTLGVGLRHSFVRCTEVATNGSGSHQTHTRSLHVDDGIPAVQVAPSLSGTPIVGSTVTCTEGVWANPLRFTYRWLADGEPIAGANGSTFRLTSDQRRKSVLCEVTASNDVGSAQPRTNDGTALRVVGAVPVNVALPGVSVASTGPKPTDQRATCNPAGWDEDYGQYTFQWLREDAPIAGATGASYDATQDDLGRLVTCQVVSTNPVGPSRPATSRPVLIPLPAAGPHAEIFAAGGGQPGGGNELDPVNLMAVSADELDALHDLAMTRLQGGIDAMKATTCKGVNGGKPNFADVLSDLLTVNQTCRVLKNDPGYVALIDDGAYWQPQPCIRRAAFGPPPAAQRAAARANPTVGNTIALTASCPKLNIPVAGIDPLHPPALEPDVAPVLQQYLPKQILWDVDNDGRVDSTCGPSAPVLRSLYETGVYSIRAVIVQPDSAATGVYPVATYPLTFFTANKGKLRPAQGFTCRTSIDPPPEPNLPCVREGQIGRVHMTGNLCPISLRFIPHDELIKLPAEIQALLKDQAVKDATPSGTRSWEPGLPALTRAASSSLEQHAGAVQNALGEFAGPSKLTIVKKWSDSIATLKSDVLDKAKDQFALDQIYMAKGTLNVNGVNLKPVADAATVLIPSDVGEAMPSVHDMLISSSEAGAALGAGLDSIPLQNPTQIAQHLTDDVKAKAQELIHANLDQLVNAVGKLKVGPFSIGGDVSVKLEDDGTATLTAEASLPALTGSPPSAEPIRTKATFHADLSGHIVLQGLHITTKSANLFAMMLKDLDITYDNVAGLNVKGKIQFPFLGNAALIINEFSLDGEGRFKKLNVSYGFGTGSGIPVGPGVFLTALGAGFATHPDIELDGNGAISIGPSAGGGCPTAGITAELHVIFGPSPKTFSIAANGVFGLLCIDLGTLDFEADSAGYVHVGGSAHLDIGPAYVSAGANATIKLPTFQFDIHGDGGIRHVIEGHIKALLSNLGIAACARVEVADIPLFGDITLAAGAGIHFTNGLPPLSPVALIANLSIFSGCDLTPFSPFGRDARAAADGASRIVTLDGKSQVQALSVVGSGGVPKVRLRSPAGVEYDYTQVGADLQKVGDRTAAMTDPAHSRLIVLIAKPQAGDWTLTPDAASVPIAQIEGATKLPAPKVSAKVGGIGASRILRYKVAPMAGQQVRLVEESGTVQRKIVTVKGGGPGKRAFLTSESRTTKRRIVAQVIQNGLPRDNIVVARFTAPSPTVGRPRVRLKRRGTTVTISWARARLAARYDVNVSVAGGSRTLLRPKRGVRKIVVRHVAAAKTVSATVIGISPGDRRGPAGKGRAKAKRPHHKRRH